MCTGLGDARLRGLCPHLSLDGGGRNNAIVEWRVTKASLPAYHSGIGLLLFLGDHVSQVFVECCRFKSHASLVEKTGDVNIPCYISRTHCMPIFPFFDDSGLLECSCQSHGMIYI